MVIINLRKIVADTLALLGLSFVPDPNAGASK
jgi:hypothetical protein